MWTGFGNEMAHMDLREWVKIKQGRNLPKIMMKRLLTILTCIFISILYYRFTHVSHAHLHITTETDTNESIRLVHISVFIAVSQNRFFIFFFLSLFIKYNLQTLELTDTKQRSDDQPLLLGIKRVIHLNRRHFLCTVFCCCCKEMILLVHRGTFTTFI